MAGLSIPSKCDTEPVQSELCKSYPYLVVADECEYIDQQTLKLQECPEAVPTGEMPRNIMLSGKVKYFFTFLSLLQLLLLLLLMSSLLLLSLLLLYSFSYLYI